MVVAGAFFEEREVQCSKVCDISGLPSTHEEADTRVILHAMHAQKDNVIVYARDTDVLLLLLAHSPKITCSNIWMMAGTAKKRQCIPIRDVVDSLPCGCLNNILAFHSITGCDTISFISGNTKKTVWLTFNNHHQLLHGLGERDLREQKVNDAELFVCKLYKISDQVRSTNEARLHLFAKQKAPEALPPTSDSLCQHQTPLRGSQSIDSLCLFL